MSSLLQWIYQHQALAAYISLWLYAAIVTTMPEPTDKSGTGYIWLYRLLHLVASNIDKIARSYVKPSCAKEKDA